MPATLSDRQPISRTALALALLWYTNKENRAVFTYGLKTLALPLLTGLPFILIGGAYGIRSSGLVPSNLSDFGLMTLNFRAIYLTCGSIVTALLAASAAYALYRRRSLALGLLLYFSVTYYFMISATEAVGYIRHAQPFYIILVLMLTLLFSDLAAALPRYAIRTVFALVLALFVFQSALAKDPYRRKTAFNFYINCFPYWQAADYLKDLGRKDLRVYAPMEVEPSHFYLAKAGLAGKIDWDRTLPKDFSADKAVQAFKNGPYDYLLLPGNPFYKVDFPAIADALEASGAFSKIKLFDYHGNKLVLLKPCAESSAK